MMPVDMAPVTGAGGLWVVVKDFADHGERCAICKEARHLQRLLADLRGAEPPLVSLESGERGDSPPRSAGSCLFIPLGHAPGWLAQARPGLLHVFEAELSFLFAAGLLGEKVIFHAAAPDPLAGLGPELVEEAVHLSDHDMLWVVVHSEDAERALREAGIRNVVRTFPLIDPDPFARVRAAARPRRTDLAVGFASMPFEAAQAGPRGLERLLELAAALPETVFCVANRSPRFDAMFSADLKRRGLRNVICTGIVPDMADFYASIDVLLVPFTARSGNHAFPFSVVEAVFCGRPVLVSRCSPVSKFVEREGLGLCCEPSLPAFIDGMRRIGERYEEFAARCRAFAEGAPRPAETAARIAALHDRMRGPRVPSLTRWRAALARRGRRLHKSPAELAAYYAPARAAKDYFTARFSSFPHSEEERTEVEIVAGVVAQVGRGRTPVIADLACGDGRLLRRLAPLGRCVAVDASRSMLDLVAQRYPGVTLCEHDLLSPELPLPPGSVDCATCFRFARHLDYRGRRLLYAKVRALLAPGGLFVLDVPNREIEVAVRDRAGWDSYEVYDVFWTRERFVEEMEAAGFSVDSLFEVGRGRWHGVTDRPLDEAPGRWVAVCTRRPDEEKPGAPAVPLVYRPGSKGPEAAPAALYERLRAFAAKRGMASAADLFARVAEGPGFPTPVRVRALNELAGAEAEAGQVAQAAVRLMRALALDPACADSSRRMEALLSTPAFGKLAAKPPEEISSRLPGGNYVTYFACAERLCAGDVWPGWWALFWHLGRPALQLGDAQVPLVGRALDLRSAGPAPVLVASVIKGAALHFCEDPASALVAAAVGTPAVVIGRSSWVDGLPAGRLVRIAVGPGGSLDGISLDRVLDAAVAAGGFGPLEAKRSETAKCRRRLLPYCEGIGLDLGHGGDKIRPEAIGVDLFKQADHDVVGDVRNLFLFADESLDYVYSSHCLEDLEDTEGALREWLRPLKVGGHLVLYLPHRAFYPNVGTPGANPGHKHDFTPDDIEALLAAIGATEIVHRGTYPAEYSFELVARKVRSARGCGPRAALPLGCRP